MQMQSMKNLGLHPPRIWMRQASKASSAVITWRHGRHVLECFDALANRRAADGAPSVAYRLKRSGEDGKRDANRGAHFE